MKIVNGNLTRTFKYGILIIILFTFMITITLIYLTYYYRPDFLGIYNWFFIQFTKLIP